MTSIFENTHSKVTVHILHDDTLTDYNRRKFLRMAEKYSQRVEFHDVTEYRSRISQDLKDFLMNNYTVGTLYKLLIHEILPLDKVIYLDGDIIVNLDICELWEIDIGDNYLAGAVDELIAKGGRYPLSYWAVVCRISGSRPETHINGGVLLMNLKKIRDRGDFFSEAMCYAIDNMHTYVSGDQKVFNGLFFGSIKVISNKYNRQIWTACDDLSESIIHTNHRKPWKFFPKMYADRLYWKMYLRSAWGENITPNEFVDVISDIKEKESVFLHHSHRQCLVRLWKGLWCRIGWTKFHMIYVIIAIIARDIKHKIKKRFARS